MAATATATTAPTYGGLTWTPFKRTDGQTAWNAVNPAGGYFYLAPNGNLFNVPQAGRFTAAQSTPAGQASALLGQASTYFANIFDPTNNVSTPTNTNTSNAAACAAGDSDICTLAGLVEQQIAAGAPVASTTSTGTDTSGDTTDAGTDSPVTYPTTTTSGPNPLAYVLLLVAAGVFFWWWKTKHADHGSPADKTGHD